MKKSRLGIRVAAWLALGCFVTSLAGCGGGEDTSSSTADPAAADSPAPEVGASGQATLLDVLHRTGKVTVSYQSQLNGNRMGNLYMADSMVWEELSFSGDGSLVMDEGTPNQRDRKIELEGRIAEDLASIVTLQAKVVTTDANGKETTERFTLRDIKVSNTYSAPRKGWETDPYVSFTATYAPEEIASHLEGWATTTKDPNGDTQESNQADLLSLYVPNPESAFELRATFAKSTE